jgi:serine/threonine protein kinase
VTKTGIKLLDFGLAKMGPAIQAGEGTMTMALTGKGEILGTFQYMSPEQVTGQVAGSATDAAPRDLPRKLLRRAAAQSAHEQVTAFAW